MESGKNRASLSILVVEDDKDAREILVAIIPRKFPDMTIYSAVNGKAGLDLFKNQAPDIVITDINMPEMGGIEMADEIRAINPHTRLIVLTADTGKATLQDAVRKGVETNHYITKPIDYRDLFAAIEQCRGELPRPPPRKTGPSL
ncbi:MAG TPA: response regulator [Geomonas sp.]